jgi:hypothetical protein
VRDRQSERCLVVGVVRERERGQSVHVDCSCDTVFVADRKWLLLVYRVCALSESQSVAAFVCVEENHSSVLSQTSFKTPEPGFS